MVIRFTGCAACRYSIIISTRTAWAYDRHVKGPGNKTSFVERTRFVRPMNMSDDTPARRGGVDHSRRAVAHKRAARARVRAVVMRAFARRALVLAAFAAVAWTRPGVARAECALASPEARTRAAEGLTEAFEAAGFEVARGAMWIFGHRDIEPDCEDCYYANPTSTYGCPMLVRRRDATNGDASARGPSLPLTQPLRPSPTARHGRPQVASPRQRVHLSRLGVIVHIRRERRRRASTHPLLPRRLPRPRP
jgi:hypothetical protein